MKEKIAITRMKGEEKSTADDWVASEGPLTITLNRQEIVTFLCTPGHLEDLAVGYLLGEGLVKSVSLIEEIHFFKTEGILAVQVKSVNKVAMKTLGKRYLTTGCGSGSSFYHLMDEHMIDTVPARSKAQLRDLQAAMKMLQNNSPLFACTGGVHACALFSGEDMLVLREDIGRHNAADKVLGWFYRQNLAPEQTCFLTTGRISSEILLKVAKAAIPILVSRSAPTSLAVDIARRINLTLVGFLRGKRANVYAGEERIFA